MTTRRPNVLLRAFGSLMPRDDRFIVRFSEHARLIVPAAEAFRAPTSGDGLAEQHAAEINRLEDEADQITRDTVLAIHRSFITPFDRSQILDLITALDDTGCTTVPTRSPRWWRPGCCERSPPWCGRHSSISSPSQYSACTLLQRWAVVSSTLRSSIRWCITLPASAAVAAVCYWLPALAAG